jgi:hypothetical protein
MGLDAVPVFRTDVKVDFTGREAVEEVRLAVAPNPTEGGAVNLGDVALEGDALAG